MPRLALIWPETGSTVWLHGLYFALPRLFRFRTLGLFDRMTAEILIARLNNDLSIDDLIAWSTQQ